MRHELIICTRNRPDDVKRCLGSVAAQALLPARVLVVDSSSDDRTAQLISDHGPAWPLDIKHVPCEPGLTHQRNVGLQLLHPKTEVVHFIDDDAVLEAHYLEAIMAAFVDEPSAGGVGGRISNLPEHCPQWYRRALLLNSSQQGALLRSGVNVLSFTGAAPRPVGWLSGCSMSYRTSITRGLSFDESRAGNGVGEDVDFSARVASMAPLLWTPFAVLEHRQSAINRETANRVQRRVIRHRWRLAMDEVGGVRRSVVLYAVLGECLVSSYKAARLRSRHYGSFALANLMGLADILMRRPV